MNITTTTSRTLAVLAGLATIAGATMAVAAPAAADTCVGKTIYATASNQTLHGTCGNDVFKVSRHVGVKIYAYGGNDEVKAGFNAGTTTAWLGEGDDQIYGGGLINVVAYGEGGHDTLEGSGETAWLFGGPGNDHLVAKGGNSYLQGDSGDDDLWASTGEQDQVNGGTGFDTAWVDGGLDIVWTVEQTS